MSSSTSSSGSSHLAIVEAYRDVDADRAVELALAHLDDTVAVARGSIVSSE